MFGYSIDQILDVANGLYIFSLVFTLALSFALWRLSSISARAKDESLARFKKEADERIAAADSVSEQARADAARANESAGKAHLRAAEVEKQNTELRQKFANRRITEDQNRILTRELAANRAVFNMEVMGDPESGLFAADILKTFTEAGWIVDKKEFPLGVIWTGILIALTDDPAAIRIANAFKAANIEFRIADQRRDKATIIVGGKPPVF